MYVRPGIRGRFERVVALNAVLTNARGSTSA